MPHKRMPSKVRRELMKAGEKNAMYKYVSNRRLKTIKNILGGIQEFELMEPLANWPYSFTSTEFLLTIIAIMLTMPSSIINHKDSK